MKLPNLPIECIRRMLTDEEMKSLKEKLSSLKMREAILTIVSSYGINSYTLEELGELGVLSDLIDASIYLYNRYELTKEALELFDEIKSNYKALDYFMRGMSELGQNLLKDPGVKQYILDTLVGPEWKEPDFYLYDDDSLKLIDKSLQWKKNISSILCDGLCVFDDIPEDRINKFYDALRRLKLYIKHRGFYYTVDNCVPVSYKEEDFPISMFKLIKRHTDMYLEWYITNNQLVIHKTFEIDDYYGCVPCDELEDFLDCLKEEYPEQMQKVYIDTHEGFLRWEHSREYNLPDDLRELNNM